MMKYCAKLVSSILLLMCVPTVALAHSVYIFAWVDGTQICTESYFTQKNKVRGGEVLMSAASGEVIAQGISGEDGTLCFSLPDQAQPLEFIVLAGAGHRGTYHMDESELADAVKARDTMPILTSAPVAVRQVDPAALQPSIDTVSASCEPAEPSSVNEAAMRRIVREELQNQLSPLRQYMAEKLEDKTPGVKDIIGGIGWLVGLGGLGLWWSHRRKKP